MSEEKTYVYDNTEVKLTGRTAHRKIEGTGRRATRVVMLHEITPADLENGSWKNWVKMSDLYEIKEPKEELDDDKPGY